MFHQQEHTAIIKLKQTNHVKLFTQRSHCFHHQGNKKKDVEEPCPIRVRITFNRKQVYYSIGINLLPNEWDSLPNTKSPKLIEARGSIQAIFDNIKKHVKKMAEDDIFSFDALNMILGKATGGTINTALKLRLTHSQRISRLAQLDTMNVL